MSARSEYLVSYAVIIIGVLLMAFFFWKSNALDDTLERRSNVMTESRAIKG